MISHQQFSIILEGNGQGETAEGQGYAGDRQGDHRGEGQGRRESRESWGHSEGRRRRRSASEGNHGNSRLCTISQIFFQSGKDREFMMT